MLGADARFELELGPRLALQPSLVELREAAVVMAFGIAAHHVSRTKR